MSEKTALLSNGSGIRTYANRNGRMRAGRYKTIERLMPLYGLETEAKPDWRSVFPDCDELHAEIGCGSGEAAIDFCRRNPSHCLVVFEVYPAGIASLLAAIEAEKITNLKVARGDALQLMKQFFSEAELDGIRVYYPDPWPKRRHRKRRLVNESFLSMAGELLREGGELHLATDWQDYAEQMFALLSEDKGWEVLAQGETSEARSGRLVTRFEKKAICEGRSSWDCRARRRRSRRG